MSAHQAYKKVLAKNIGATADQISLMWKGRVGMYGVLEALGVTKGDEVIIPAFTCVVVPSAIIYLGAKPIYIDIDPQTYNIDISKVEAAITKKTKLIIAQNTFGLSSDLDALYEIANRHQIEIIEDCTHGYGGHYKGKANGTIAKASFYSSQWNKAFSTGLGGMVFCRDEGLAYKMQAFENRLIEPSKKETFSLSLQILIKNYLLPNWLYWGAIKVYRFLSQKNLITGSSQGTELEKPEMPEGFLKGMSSVQSWFGAKEVDSLKKNLDHRKKIAQIYQEEFEALGLGKVYVPDYAEHTFVKYPFFVKDRAAFLKLAETNKVSLGDWFITPIHPVDQYELWQFPYGEFKTAEYISKHILNLPTDLNTSEREAKRICGFLKDHVDELLSFNGIHAAANAV